MEFSSSRHTLQVSNASAGLSAFSRSMAITRNCIAKTRSDVLRASLQKASVAFLRASLNLTFASERALVAWTSWSLSCKLLISLARQRGPNPVLPTKVFPQLQSRNPNGFYRLIPIPSIRLQRFQILSSSVNQWKMVG